MSKNEETDFDIENITTHQLETEFACKFKVYHTTKTIDEINTSYTEKNPEFYNEFVSTFMKRIYFFEGGPFHYDFPRATDYSFSCFGDEKTHYKLQLDGFDNEEMEYIHQYISQTRAAILLTMWKTEYKMPILASVEVSCFEDMMSIFFNTDIRWIIGMSAIIFHDPTKFRPF